MRTGNIAAAILAAIVLTSLVTPEAFRSETQRLLSLTLAHMGWFFLLTSFTVLSVMLYLAIGKYRNVRLGGPDAEPAFRTASWLAMMFAAGMGVGLVFFGASEPLSHLRSPPPGIEPGSLEAARIALPATFFHWGLNPWGVFGLMALALGYSRYNRGTSGQMNDLLRPVLGDWADGPVGKFANLLALLATVGGVATTLGLSAIQIGGGIERLTGLPGGRGMELILIASAAVVYLVSASSGVGRGIKWLSNTNLVLSAILVVAVFAFGPTTFILNVSTTGLGQYLNRLPSMNLNIWPFSDSTWTENWTMFFWAWGMSWSPFVGTFIARISRGRTIREFVGGVLLVPALVGCIWIGTLGGTVLYLEIFEGAGIAAEAQGQNELVLFLLFEHLPLSAFLSWLAIALLSIFFVTSGDSATMVLAQMATEGREDPRLRTKLLWGLLIAAIAAVLLLSGGLKGLEAGAVLTALPFAGVLCAVIVSLLRLLRAEERGTD